MATFLSIPILGGLLLIQSAILTHFPLLRGTADLVLVAVVAWALQKRTQTAWRWGIIGGLMVGLASGLQFWASVIIYLAATGIALALRQRVWQAPILAVFIAVFISTLVAHFITFVALRLGGTSLPLLQTLNLISLPSVILNLVFAIPLFYMLADLAKWLYPEELEA
jgi:rod shape-determining protein MreD